MSASVGNMWFSNASSLVLTAMLTAAFVPFGDSFSTLRVAHHDISLRKAPSLVLKMISPEKGGKVNGDAVGVYGASDIVHFGGVADILDFVLEEHKPLGCSADESLADEPDGSKHVFVSKVREFVFSGPLLSIDLVDSSQSNASSCRLWKEETQRKQESDWVTSL